jgi:hypothetical protein
VTLAVTRPLAHVERRLLVFVLEASRDGFACTLRQAQAVQN